MLGNLETNAYFSAYRDAADTEATPPLPIRRGYPVVDGKRTVAVWCATEKDHDGCYWSFRMSPTTFTSRYENWKPHKQRAAAVAWAKSSASVEWENLAKEAAHAR